jgi:hypothetical protein
MKSTTGFPVIEAVGEYRVFEVRVKNGKRSRKSFPFCNLATEEQNAEGLYGLVEYKTADLARCTEAASFAARMNARMEYVSRTYVVERIVDRVEVAEFVS